MLEQKLMERYGLSQKQANNAVCTTSARRIIEVFAEESGLLERSVVSMVESANNEILRAEIMKKDAKEQAKQNEQTRKNLLMEREKLNEEKKAFKILRDDLLSVETAEAKDRIRLLEIFKKNVSVHTPQNNTAFIAGCAAILAGFAKNSNEPAQIIDNYIGDN